MGALVVLKKAFLRASPTRVELSGEAGSAFGARATTSLGSHGGGLFVAGGATEGDAGGIRFSQGCAAQVHL